MGLFGFSSIRGSLFAACFNGKLQLVAIQLGYHTAFTLRSIFKGQISETRISKSRFRHVSVANTF